MQRAIEQLSIELVVDVIWKALDENVASDGPGITVVDLEIGCSAPPVDSLPRQPERKVVCQRADSDLVLGGDRRNDVLQALDRVPCRAYAGLGQSLSLTIEHDVAGELAGGDFLIGIPALG